MMHISVNQVDVNQSIRKEAINIAPPAVLGTADFAKALGRTSKAAEPRATHRRLKRQYKTRMRMPSMLDPHLDMIKGWLTAGPQLTALTILSRLIECYPSQSDPRQASIVQRLIKALRFKAAQQIIAETASHGEYALVQGMGCKEDNSTTQSLLELVKFVRHTISNTCKTPLNLGNIFTLGNTHGHFCTLFYTHATIWIIRPSWARAFSRP